MAISKLVEKKHKQIVQIKGEEHLAKVKSWVAALNAKEKTEEEVLELATELKRSIL